MNIDLELFLKSAGAIALVLLGKYSDRWFEKKPKLIIYLSHSSAFVLRNVNPANAQIHTHAIIVRNTGRLAAKNIRLGHYTLPENYQVFPAIEHRVERVDDRIHEIIIPVLVPNEQITVTYLYPSTLLWSQIHAYSKSDDGFMREIKVLPTPQASQWLVRSIQFLTFLGSALLVYWAFSFGIWAIGRMA